MKNLFKNKPLSHFSIVIGAIIIVPSIIFLIVFDKNMQNNLELEAINKNRVTSHLISNSIEQLLLSNDYVIKGVEFSLDAHSELDDKTVSHLTEIVENSEFLFKIDIIDFDGTLLLSSDKTSILGINKSGEAFYTETIMNGKDYYWSSPYIPPLEDTLAVTITHRSDSYLFVGYVDLSALSQIQTSISTSESTHDVNIIVTDNYGLFIISDDPLEVVRRYRYSHFDELKESLLQGEDTTYIEDEGFVALATITETSNGWYVISYENLNSINALEISIRNDFTLFIVIVMTVTVSLVLYAINLLKSSFETVTTKMKEVTGGNLNTVIQEESLMEINQITDSFNKMTESLIDTNEELTRKSNTDSLTGLLTRKALFEYFGSFTNEFDLNFVLFYIDLERFASINESYGIGMADKCLVEVSDRLRTLDSALTARAESDEFLVVYESVLSKAKSIEIAKKILLLFSRPFIIDGVEITINAKIGISRFPIEEQNLSHLITSSTIALKQAKDYNKSFMFYEPEMGEGYLRQVDLELSLKDAFRNNEFYAELQPIVDCTNNKIEKFELLARWNSPSMGNVYPDDFIPILERTNNIHQLDLHMLELGIQAHQTINNLYGKKYAMCINLSVKHIHRDDFIFRISSLVERYKIEPKYIELEVTETIFIENYDIVKAKMDELIKLGFRFSQDDFGDGYSSLSYLAKLDLSTLKISKSFLTNLSDTNNVIMVESIVNLSKELDIEIIVEGVEDLETLEFFKSHNCRLIQGYYYYKPMKFEEIIELLKGDAL